MEIRSTVWRYRMEDDHARGIVINKAGVISREEAEAILERRYQRKVIELEPVT